ncbi:DNA replication protein DnaD [Carnobacterium divergens]|uniref:Putative DNA replication protein DnaD n=1 Tax=Carnobacterium divergens DSM 20623 TaxID=1449336 RepID=A0A0R2HVI6_CARDV|nr:DnaD domain protein [Carnobacterium divergens]ANZ99992.1 DNA replication protein DnaD [Carnobacterium divergens]KRN54364.1 putative DNA replication protein DnaD [Carnobacterium divergens DSM 20623]MDO0873851.1 DnaD domain protein [Carnobacterium divergens]MDT1997508.1 DnaD domain protein [Carnobacterium divergens]MDT2010888.1 DnaD domain protein [Carnobacterium divergens]
MDNHILQSWLKAGNTSISNLLLKHYHKIGLTNNELILVIQLKSLMDEGILFPDTQEIAMRMNESTDGVFHGIHQLIQKKVLAIETDKTADGKTQDAYSLTQLWDKLALLLIKTETETVKVEEVQNEKELFQQFESEFGRPLSPIEIETIGMWLDEDHYPIDLIELALREAVLSQVYNLKYVDRILLNWERKNIRTKDQVVKESTKHRQSQVKQSQNPTNESAKNTTKVPLHNWLNNDSF